jgi:hypothetical protein
MARTREATAMAGFAGGKAKRAARARAPGIGAELGLGQYLGTWDGAVVRDRVVWGCLLLPLSVAIIAWGLRGGLRVAELVTGCVLLAVSLAMAKWPWGRELWVHHYTGGLARLAGDRVSVLPWADLAGMESLAGGEDGACRGIALRDRAGIAFVSLSVNSRQARPILRHAEQVIAGRGPGSV